jgi:hypothetical protein
MGSLTSDLMAILDDLSLPVRVAWGVWFAWAGVQLLWYRRSRPQERVYRTTPARPRLSGSRIAAARSQSSGSRPVARATTVPVAPGVDTHIGGTPEFLAALGLHKRTPIGTTEEETSVYR